ncbi:MULTISPECIES: EAL domain-containing protein [Henriciella]|jgi:EAL domain-containing protein (putative c-di-GMP-specific phosphodiesterase class I)|uniref:EAL domain-containing protein n=1 Tax=Henriciella TaxID=453849 RepID=UPI00351411FA
MDLTRLNSRIFELDGGHQAFDFGTFIIRSAFQPIYAINNSAGMLYGVEALARPLYKGRSIEPLDFFSRLSDRDRFVADWACLLLHLANTAAWRLGNTSLFVNLNPGSCRYTDQMMKGLEHYKELVCAKGLDPSNVVFEITEEDGGDKRALATIVDKLKSLGFRTAIDDFGVGSSDLMRVIELQPDIVKVDAGWFRKMMEQEDSRQLAHSIIVKLHETRAHLLFEGVETPRELHWARECAGSLIQGWLFGKATHLGEAAEARKVAVPSTQVPSKASA